MMNTINNCYAIKKLLIILLPKWEILLYIVRDKFTHVKIYGVCQLPKQNKTAAHQTNSSDDYNHVKMGKPRFCRPRLLMA